MFLSVYDLYAVLRYLRPLYPRNHPQGDPNQYNYLASKLFIINYVLMTDELMD